MLRKPRFDGGGHRGLPGRGCASGVATAIETGLKLDNLMDRTKSEDLFKIHLFFCVVELAFCCVAQAGRNTQFSCLSFLSSWKDRCVVLGTDDLLSDVGKD